MGVLLQKVFISFFCRHSKLRITYPNDKCRSFPLLIWQCNCTQEFVHNLNYWVKKFLDYWNRLSFDIRIPIFVVFIFTSLPPMKQYLKRNWIKSFSRVSRLLFFQKMLPKLAAWIHKWNQLDGEALKVFLSNSFSALKLSF